MHNLIGDVFMITTNPADASSQASRFSSTPQKTLLYDFAESGRNFSVEDLDIIICNRLTKQVSENKFTYLYESFERLENHVFAKIQSGSEKIKEMKSIIARYFVLCLGCPEMFELPNDPV